MKEIYYLNADFDLVLGKRPVEKFRPMVDELSLCFYPAFDKDDILYTEVNISEDYKGYLQEAGFELPGIYRKDINLKGLRAQCWGWNKESAEKMSATGVKVDHPDLEIIKKVNSREFSNEICKKYDFPLKGETCTTIESLEEALKKIKPPFVIKPEYSNAGIGFIIKDRLPLEEREREKLKQVFRNKKRVMIEPWKDRVADYSVGFTIDKSGNFTNLNLRETEVNARGVFQGVKLFPTSYKFTTYYKDLIDTARKVSAELHRQGYYGPVGIDSFVYRNTMGKEVLNPLNEINCRYTIAEIGNKMKNKISVELFATLIFINDKNKNIPDNYRQLKETLGALSYSKEKQSGILLLTPLNKLKDGEKQKRNKKLFFIAASTHGGVIEMRSRLEEILRR